MRCGRAPSGSPRRQVRSRIGHVVVALTAAVTLAVPALAAEPRAEPVTFDTADGFALHADLWRASAAQAPVVILLHQFNQDRRSWSALVPALSRAGFTVLALDQRGQGESTEQRTSQGARVLRVQELPRDEVGPIVSAGTADVAAARAFLERQGVAVDRLALVGSSYGCSVSLLAAREVPGVRALALLSPGVAYFGVDIREAAARFPGALLAVAAADDPESAESVRVLAVARGKGTETIAYPTGGHGVALLAAHPALTARIADFLAKAEAP